MQKFRNITVKRFISCLLAVTVCTSMSMVATATDNEDETISFEPPVVEAVEEVVPPEEEVIIESEQIIENDAQLFSASSLLVTGGHDTYLGGYSGALFMPDRTMTRAEAAQMLYNLLAAKPAVDSSAFSDVPSSSWFYLPVNALAKVGVLGGYDDGTFMPNEPITRAEFVTVLIRCFTLKAGTANFVDVPETHWAYRNIAAATTAGWIGGMGDGRFEPNRGIKRCEAVKVMNVALGRTGDGYAADREVQKFTDVPKNHWAFLDIAEAAAPPDAPVEEGEFTVGQTVQVSVSSGLNMRSAPDSSASLLARLSKGTVLTVTSVSDYPWLGVKTSSGTAGYVHSGNDDGWYVVDYTPGAVSGLALSASSLSMHRYQTARLDASVISGSLKDLSWSSSNPDVAVVGYTVGYGSGSSEHGAFVYAKNTGTATLTISDSSGKSKQSCTITVTAPESVRYAYSSENTALVGESFNLIAVTDTGRSSVTFKVSYGGTGTYTTDSYTEESRSSSYGLPTNHVRVFKRAVTFNKEGLYKIRASANNFSDYQEFEVLVRPAGEKVTDTTYNERRITTRGLNIIANYEGSVPEIEDDVIAAGNPTVGYGFVVRQNQCFYNNMTPSEMRGKLVDAVNSNGYSSAVNRFRANNNLKMSQAQFDALVSFVYNCGTGSLSTDYGTFRVMLNAVIPPSNLSESQPCSGKINVYQYTSGGKDLCNIYEDKSLGAKTVTTISEGETLSVIGTYADEKLCQRWYKVRYNSKTGWIPAGYVQLNTSGLVHDLAYSDAIVLSNNYMQWHKSGSSHYEGLLYRRLAECKMFFFGNYDEAYHSNPNYDKNNCGFNPPSCCAGYVNG